MLGIHKQVPNVKKDKINHDKRVSGFKIEHHCSTGEQNYDMKTEQTCFRI